MSKIEEKIKKWEEVSEKYNDLLQGISDKYQKGETIYTQLGETFAAILTDLKELNQPLPPDANQNYDAGFYCNHCGSYNKRYRRKLNSNMAAALIQLYKNPGGDFVHLENFLASKGLKRCGDASYLRFYNFIEKKKDKRADGSSRNGFYRITGLGCLFVEKKITAKETFLILHNRLEGFEGKEIYIDEVPKFN